MPYYASTFTGVPHPARPQQSIIAPTAIAGTGYTGAWQIVAEMRTDDTTPTGRCIIWTESNLPSTPSGVRLVATGPDGVLSAAVRTWASSNLGVTIPAGMTLRTAIRRLRTSDAAARGWLGQLQPQNGRYVVALGELIETWQA